MRSPTPRRRRSPRRGPRRRTCPARGRPNGCSPSPGRSRGSTTSRRATHPRRAATCSSWSAPGATICAPEDVLAAARSTPHRRWHVAGALRAPDATNVTDHGPRAPVRRGLLRASSVVVGTAGSNIVAEVAAARRPFVCLPQARPFGSRHVRPRRSADSASRRCGPGGRTRRNGPALLSAVRGATDATRWADAPRRPGRVAPRRCRSPRGPQRMRVAVATLARGRALHLERQALAVARMRPAPSDYVVLSLDEEPTASPRGHRGASPTPTGISDPARGGAQRDDRRRSVRGRPRRLPGRRLPACAEPPARSHRGRSRDTRARPPRGAGRAAGARPASSTGADAHRAAPRARGGATRAATAGRTRTPGPRAARGAVLVALLRGDAGDARPDRRLRRALRGIRSRGHRLRLPCPRGRCRAGVGRWRMGLPPAPSRERPADGAPSRHRRATAAASTSAGAAGPWKAGSMPSPARGSCGGRGSGGTIETIPSAGR